MNLSSAIPTSVSFLDVLRSQTAEKHSQLESLPLSQAIVSPEVSIEKCCRYLQKMLPFVEQVERQIFPVIAAHLPDTESRAKSNLILADLQFLKAATKAENRLLALPETINPAFAFGIAYVLEGSTLGGRYILNNITSQLHLSADHGASYFAGYQNQTGTKWKFFLNALQTFASPSNQQQIIDGAQFAFHSLFQQLEHD